MTFAVVTATYNEVGDRRSAPPVELGAKTIPLTRSASIQSNDIVTDELIDTTAIGSEIYQIVALPDANGDNPAAARSETAH